MSSTSDLVRTVLLAFLAGTALPIFVQLFLTLRSLQRATGNVERRVDEASREISAVLASLRKDTGGPDVMSLLASAAIPAVVAAVRAFRAAPSSDLVPSDTTHSPQEKTS